MHASTCKHTRAHMHTYTHVGMNLVEVRGQPRSWFSPATLWNPGIALRSSGTRASFQHKPKVSSCALCVARSAVRQTNPTVRGWMDQLTSPLGHTDNARRVESEFLKCGAAEQAHNLIAFSFYKT